VKIVKKAEKSHPDLNPASSPRSNRGASQVFRHSRKADLVVSVSERASDVISSPRSPPTSCRGASQPSPPLSRARLSQGVSPHWCGAAVVSVQRAYRDHRHRNNRGAEQQKRGMGTAPGDTASEGAVLPPGHCCRGCGDAAGTLLPPGKRFGAQKRFCLGKKHISLQFGQRVTCS